MPDPEWLDQLDPAEARRLVWNGSRVQALQNALAQFKSRSDTIPALVEEIIQEGCWLRWVDGRNRSFGYSKAEFRRFVEAPRDEGGCETPLYRLLEIVDSTETLPILNEALRGDQGAPEGNKNAAGPRTGNLDLDGCNSNRDIITDCFAPTIIPIQPRDYASEAQTGTSVSYIVRRLKNNRPDLLERVKAGELTPHGAMVAAGFKLKSITIDDDPERAARRLLRHFQGDRLEALIRALSEGLRAD